MFTDLRFGASCRIDLAMTCKDSAPWERRIAILQTNTNIVHTYRHIDLYGKNIQVLLSHITSPHAHDWKSASDPWIGAANHPGKARHSCIGAASLRFINSMVDQWIIQDFPNRTLSEVWTLYMYIHFSFPSVRLMLNTISHIWQAIKTKKTYWIDPIFEIERTSLGNKTHAWSTRSHTTKAGGRVPTTHCGEAKHQQRCQDAVAGDENHLDLPEI